VSGIQIGSLVKLPKNQNIGIVIHLKNSDAEHYYLDNVFAEVYWSHLSRAKMEFIGDLELISN